MLQPTYFTFPNRKQKKATDIRIVEHQFCSQKTTHPPTVHSALFFSSSSL